VVLVQCVHQKLPVILIHQWIRSVRRGGITTIVNGGQQGP